MNSKAFLCIALILPSSGNGYELGTHARLTNEAYLRSVLATDAALLPGLDVQAIGNAFGETYYDMSGAIVEERMKDDFEESGKRMPSGINPLSVPGWLMRGAIREDDHVRRTFPCRVNAPNPQNPLPTDRVKNHFYDPIYDQPLETWFGIDIGERAPAWGMGVQNAFIVPGQPDAARHNHFSLTDSFEAYYRALTAHTRDGSRAIAPDGVEPSTPQQEAEVRKAYWATLFRSLGDMVHLIQDMAQPQHTRNDAHSGICGKWMQDNVVGHESVYERYIEARAKGEKFVIPGAGPVDTEALNYAGYAAPVFDDYASYFSSRHVHPSLDQVMQRTGLADYSNRGFFTAGMNMGNTRYELPANTPDTYEPVPITDDWAGNALPSGAEAVGLRGGVVDGLTGVTEQAVLTTQGLWDQFLIQQGETAQYTLTKVNYDDMARLLIPRAVAYSAGFLDFFFRGRVDVVSSVIGEAGGVGELRIRVINRSAASGRTYALNQGSFLLYYHSTTGTMRGATLAAGAGIGEGGIAYGQEHELVAGLPEDLDYSVANPFVLVYDGRIGQDTGIAGGVFGVEKFYVSFYGASNIVKLDGLGNQYATYASGVESTRDIAVHDGMRYATEPRTLYKDGAYFADAAEFLNGVATNAENVFAAEYISGENAQSLVHVYGHDGTFVASLSSATPSYPWGSEQNISANDVRLCIVDKYESSASLFSVSGQYLTRLTAWPDVGAVWACGSTHDRHYVYALDGGIGQIMVYDNSGAHLSTIPLSEGAWKGFGIGASNTTITVPAFYEGSIYIIHRSTDTQGLDTFKLNRILDVRGIGIYPSDVAVDQVRPFE